MQYLVHSRTDQLRDDHKAGGVEPLNGVAQVLDPEYPLDAARSVNWYRADRIKNRFVAVAVRPEPLERLGHRDDVGFSGSEYINGADSQELDGVLNERDRDSIRGMLTLNNGAYGTRELPRATAGERVHQEAVPELVAKPIQVGENLVVTGQPGRCARMTTTKYGFGEHTSVPQDRFNIELFEAAVAFAIHPGNKRPGSEEMIYGSPRSVGKPCDERARA